MKHFSPEQICLAGTTEPRQHPFCQFSGRFTAQGFSCNIFKSLVAGRLRDGTAEVRSLTVLGGTVWGRFVLRLLWIKRILLALNLSSPPLLFRKGLEGDLDMRRKVKLLTRQLETLCAVLCPRPEQSIILKLEVLGKTISSVEYLTVRILQAAESQHSFVSIAAIVGRKSKHFQGRYSF